MTTRITENEYKNLLKKSEKTPSSVVKNKQAEKLIKAISGANGNGKYRNKICYFNNMRFPSQLERDRYILLKDMLSRGEIFNLKTQVRFDFSFNDVHLCFYLADFTYDDKNGVYCVEDAKGKKTRVYEIKKAMMKAFYNIDIIEVYSNK